MFKKIRLSLSIQIVIAIIAGLILGPILGPKASSLGALGKLYIQLIKTVAAPLVFFAIVDSLLKTSIKKRHALRLFGITSVNATIAALIGLSLANLFKPGEKLHLEGIETAKSSLPLITEKFNFVKALEGYIPSHLFQPFLENNILVLVVYAVLLGSIIRVIRNPENGFPQEIHKGAFYIEDICLTLFKVFEILLEWVVKITPFAVFGVLTKTIGEYGWAPLQGLAWYVGVGVLGLCLHPFITYQLWISLYTRLSLKEFWREAKNPVIFGLGCNSSLATLPITLKALDKLKISKASSRLGACIGTNLNNDGILLYEAMAVFFVAQYHGYHMHLNDQVFAMITCVIAAIGIAGVPEAGIVSLSLVLSTVGLPLEILPLLITVDWILARMRTGVNVLADMTVSTVLDEMQLREEAHHK